MDDVVLHADRIQEEVIRVFKKHGLPLSLGVIPFSEDQRGRDKVDSGYIDQLRTSVNNGELEIVLHGFSHTKNTHSTLKTEFAGRTLPDQMSMLQRGQDYLQNKFQVPVHFFAPPWNTYDINTLKALQTLGFKGITADLGGVSLSNGLAYLPATTIDFQDWGKLLEWSDTKQGVIVVLFHSYTFSDTGFTFNNLDSVLALTVANGNQCHTFSGYTQQSKVFPSANRYRVNAKLRYSRMFFFLPNREQHVVLLESSKLFLITVGLMILAFLTMGYGIWRWFM
jgi:hypothetical protein